MPRAVPSPLQNLLSSVILPLLSLTLLPVSLAAVVLCRMLGEKVKIPTISNGTSKGCVMISGGRMSKGLALARAFKRAGWKVIGVEEKGWGELCPMRFSSSVDHFHLLPTAATSYSAYSSALLHLAKQHRVTLFIPVSGAGSSVEDARAADGMFKQTEGTCRTFIQDPETMLDLHDKDRFMNLVSKLGFTIPSGKMVESVEQAMEFLRGEEREPRFVLKCMGLDENRGDMTLFPLWGDDDKLSSTRKWLNGLRLSISPDCPYVFQEYIPGQEWCTHASVIDGRITSFVTCPSNDMLMTYENATTQPVGQRAEIWTQQFLSRLQNDPTSNGDRRTLTGHFSFDFIESTRNGELYPIECNARVHTAVIMLPLSGIADCYDPKINRGILRPPRNAAPRSWIYNDLIMRYLPYILPRDDLLAAIHPSLPGSRVSASKMKTIQPKEDRWVWRKDPTLIRDDCVPFIVLWHVYWPALLLIRWWKGKKWTRLNVSTGRIFEA